jgi:hypothetical protein
MSWSYAGQRVTFAEFRDYRASLVPRKVPAGQFDALPIRFRPPGRPSHLSLFKTVGELVEENEEDAPFRVIDPFDGQEYDVIDVERPGHGACLLFHLAAKDDASQHRSAGSTHCS